ncbi:uncharacterized protein PHACADRAFT_127350 [Phanerochaete carnosa HHB-10118-sp]|uniref:Mitochondrial K+-H+ exchange-related-domain-containing protein n=1 Tax=Phanerochaete carnosa (strain HHB-10118-sp) TaxID=650164 RepID=K5VYD6_PHACS|nr:uncharacterized protein PHACADRAFT_127350 [Phanerochaete carnosa HHB-10118-sp]EKM51624.1 hypothetical protein PHACADRAFT_127350 [Phanerochaete carnosa HHB-10118-sp]
MSGVPQVAKQSLRIVALPLVTASRTPERSSSGHLTYYHFATPPPKQNGKRSWVQWATHKAADIWAGFGKAPEGHWKRRTFSYGESLVDRIDFEELALKSLDPSLGPKLSRFGHSEAEVKPNSTIPLIYPSSACSSPVTHLRSLVEKRGPRHRKGFFTWILVSPLTAPFMLIPVIPNLPFFFCVWRSWSHYKAYKASSYLEQLLDKGAIVAEPSSALDRVYAKYAKASKKVSPTPSTVETSSEQDLDSDASSTPSAEEIDNVEHRHLLLTRDAVPELMAALQLKPGSTFAADMYRALEQANLRLKKAEPDMTKG